MCSVHLESLKSKYKKVGVLLICMPEYKVKHLVRRSHRWRETRRTARTLKTLLYIPVVLILHIIITGTVYTNLNIPICIFLHCLRSTQHFIPNLSSYANMGSFLNPFLSSLLLYVLNSNSHFTLLVVLHNPTKHAVFFSHELILIIIIFINLLIN